MELQNIAIIGPRGNIGSALITELLKDGSRWNITAITRLTSTYTPPSDVTLKTVDFESLDSLTDAFEGVNAIVNCLPGGAVQYEPTKRIIDAAIAAGVKFFFANEFVGDITREQYLRMPESFVGAKVRIRQYLEELGKQEKIAWTALNGGPFFDMWLMKGPAGFDILNRHARIYGTGENPLYWTPFPTIILAAANMLRNPTPILNRPIHIFPFASPSNKVSPLTQNILLETLESVLETKFTVEHIDIKKINENTRIALDRGEVPKAMRGLAVSNQFYEGDSGNDLSALEENELVGVQGTSVEAAVRDAIAKWGTNGPVVEAMFRVDPCEV